MRRHWSVGIALVFAAAMFVAAGSSRVSRGGRALASEPSTQPATATAGTLPVNSLVRKWFAQLDDADPQVREEAVFNLMGINREELEGLRLMLICQPQAVLPSQAAVMHDIVLHVFLANEKYDTLSEVDAAANGVSQYFLGISASQEDNNEDRLGVPISETLPGFPSFRYLRRGDMILGVYLDTDAPLSQLPNMLTHKFLDVTAALGRRLHGPDIALEVLREGREIKIPLKAVIRPEQTLDNVHRIGFVEARMQKAETFWKEQFAPLIEGDEGM